MSPSRPSTVLSVVIPIYNELDLWRELVRRVSQVSLGDIGLQIILIDDASTDGTREQIQSFEQDRRAVEPETGRWIEYVVLYHSRNLGKGGALRTGFAAASGDFVIVQDADLEYDPEQYPEIITPLLEGRAKVVYGSRFFAGKPRHAATLNYLANRVLTAFSNWTTGLRLSDMETCYKAFRLEVIQSIRIEQERFGFEPEITAKVAAMGLAIVEVPVRYVGRSKAQGKKIGFSDGLEAMGCIWKYRPRKTVGRNA